MGKLLKTTNCTCTCHADAVAGLPVPLPGSRRMAEPVWSTQLQTF